jgi:hypothetical protein
MKNKMLLTAGLCSTLYLPAISAQNESKGRELRDTIVIKPDADVQIFFMGNNLREMAKYKKADSLKTLLIDDWEKARHEPSYPATSKTTHYFVHPNGKRRLKAESDDYQEPALEVRKEIQSLSLNLPPYEFIIYDLANNYEIQLYFNKPDQLADLKNINLNEAISSITGDAQALKAYYRVDLENSSGQWKMNKHFSNRKLEIGMVGSINLSAIGSQLSPGISLGACFTLTDKLAIPVFGIDLLYNQYFFGGNINNNFGNLNGAQSIDLRILYNDNLFKNVKHYTKQHGASDWAGFDFGYMLPSTADVSSPLGNNFKMGLSLYFNRVNVTLDWIYLTNPNNTVFQFTVAMPIVLRRN